MQYPKVSEIVQKMETDYINGNTRISKYVTFDMNGTIEKIYAYLNSKHISGDTDSLGRKKPFFNIVTATVNIWFRATDIPRSKIRLSARKQKDWVNSFFVTIVLQDWMKREEFGQYLKKWGRTLAKFGSAITKIVENSSGLHISVLPWNRIICDPVSFDSNPKIEILELTEQELRERIDTNGYDKDRVESLITAKTTRETVGKLRKDNKNDYYKLYEVHHKFRKSLLTDDKDDEKEFIPQVWVISFVGSKKKKSEDDTFVLFKGREKESPYYISHLFEEDERTLSIGAVEYLFQDQWIQNATAKAIKDQLDLASKIVFQTSDSTFVGRNIISLEQGSILTHSLNQPLSQLYNASHDTESLRNFAVTSRELAREAVGISEAMLGREPKSGTPWRLTEAILGESYSLFTTMTENKGLALEKMIRERILNYILKKYKNDEIAAILESHDITRLDKMYIKNEAIRRVNMKIFDVIERALENENEELITPESQQVLISAEEEKLQNDLNELGNARFVKPDEVDWKAQFKDIEWDLDIDITDENKNIQESLTSLNTALQIMINPEFEQNKRAQAVVGRILELTHTMSPVEYNALPKTPVQESGSAGVPEKVPQ